MPSGTFQAIALSGGTDSEWPCRGSSIATPRAECPHVGLLTNLPGISTMFAVSEHVEVEAT